jgi:hypothetical protein
MKNYYEILNIQREATTQEIIKSYRTLALKYHPDRNPDPKAVYLFIEATEAYEILRDSDKRKVYDDLLKNKQKEESTIDFSKWKEQAKKDAETYSKMNADSLFEKLTSELSLLAKNSVPLGCSIVAGMGIIIGLVLVIVSASSGDGEKAFLGLFVLVFYVIILAIFYPMFKTSYKFDKENSTKAK